MKHDPDSWHDNLYDTAEARDTIDSAEFHKKARNEVTALIRFLDLKKGNRLLDVPCGSGRHSALFARRGIDVTAADINKDCLALARRNRGRIKFRLERADMRNLKRYHGKFDVVVNLFSSFGYFSTDKKNEAVLRQLIATLKPGGRIALHNIDRDWLLSVFRPMDWEENSGVHKIEVRKYEPNTRYIAAYRITIDQNSGKMRSHYHRIRLYSKSEMVTLMKKCGLKRIQVIGNYQGKPFTKGISTHPIYIGWR